MNAVNTIIQERDLILKDSIAMEEISLGSIQRAMERKQRSITESKSELAELLSFLQPNSP